ncbi:MAG TPA: hypothetical protein VK510_03190 [Solirubrobacteraceae bacterium]|nr:hypothetical protein [Solirubrobacteraceae bacterium]
MTALQAIGAVAFMVIALFVGDAIEGYFERKRARRRAIRGGR